VRVRLVHVGREAEGRACAGAGVRGQKSEGRIPEARKRSEARSPKNSAVSAIRISDFVSAFGFRISFGRG
jgi:hypothetical protein